MRKETNRRGLNPALCLRAAALVLAFVSPALAQFPRPADSKTDSPILERIGAWPYGQALAVAADPARNLVYLGSGGVVFVLDTTDPTPVLLSDDMHTLGLVKDIHYDSATERLFLACGEGGLEIWDVHDPSNPAQLSVYEVLYYGYDTPVDNVDVLGDYAIVDCSWGYVRSIDVSDPTNPHVVGGSSQMGQSSDIYISEDGLLHTVGSQAYYRFRIDHDGSLDSYGFYDKWTGSTNLIAGNADVAFAHHAG